MTEEGGGAYREGFCRIYSTSSAPPGGGCVLREEGIQRRLPSCLQYKQRPTWWWICDEGEERTERISVASTVQATPHLVVDVL